MILKTSEQIGELLRRSKSIAVVGASDNPARPSHDIFTYLRKQGQYAVAPINPSVAHVDGVKTYPSIAAYAHVAGAPDIVDVFRKASEVVEVTSDAIAAGAKAIWFQLGVINDAAIELADRAGLDVVVDRCIKIDHRSAGLP